LELTVSGQFDQTHPKMRKSLNNIFTDLNRKIIYLYMISNCN